MAYFSSDKTVAAQKTTRLTVLLLLCVYSLQRERVQTHRESRETAEELLEAVLSLLSDHELHKEGNSLLMTVVI
jgi:hypothetical protein